MWYSPDGRHLAFASFNDTLVKNMAYFHYGLPGSLDDQYPKEVKIKYPKVGAYSTSVYLCVRRDLVSNIPVKLSTTTLSRHKRDEKRSY